MPKIIRDPIHNIIEIDDYALQLIDTRTFQRLRRIRQLGLAWFVYPTAEHSRFTHSLGVYHLSKRLLNVLQSRLKRDDVPDASYVDKLDEDRRVLALSALLHDIGHGAFSHTLEKAIKELGGNFNHEEYTKKIILEDAEINDILTRIDEHLPSNICKVIDKEYENPIITMLVSSQLDADRMDYLLRDSHMTGARYGSYDIEWILQHIYIRTITVETEEIGNMVIAIDLKKCLNTIEQYILGRFFMYKHVYNHRVVRGFECILRGIFKRVLKEDHRLIGVELLKGFSDNSLPLENFLDIDDFTVIEWFKNWYGETNDEVLKELLRRFFYRDPLKAIDLIDVDYFEAYDKLASYCDQLGIEKEYFLYHDRVYSQALKEYDELKYITDAIYVIKDDGQVTKIGNTPLSFISNIKGVLEKEEYRCYVKEEVYNKYKREGL
jgi:hypothetical protein